MSKRRAQRSQPQRSSDREVGRWPDRGFYVNTGTWTFIPEPATGLLLATGLTMLGARRRRH